MDPKLIYTIAHLIGVALGAGGAFVSDALFFSSIKNKRLSGDELRLLKTASTVVWIGLLILLLSGIGLYSLDPSRYNQSGKFLAKMTIVAIITLNGIIFHRSHLPFLMTQSGKTLDASRAFRRRAPFLLASGAVSAVSWVSAIILGAIRKSPLPYGELMIIYFAILIPAILVALVMAKRISRSSA